jgi:hypothetical protein
MVAQVDLDARPTYLVKLFGLPVVAVAVPGKLGTHVAVEMVA